MTSTSASPATLVFVAPVERMFNWSASPLMATCITSVALKKEPSPQQQYPLIIQSPQSVLHYNNNEHSNSEGVSIVDNADTVASNVDATIASNVDATIADVVASIADCNAYSGNDVSVVTPAADYSKNSSSSSSAAIVNRTDDDEDHSQDPRYDLIEPLILAKRKKSKRRRWILSRKPKCISRTQRIIFPSVNKPITTTPRQNNSAKRKLLMNGTDAEASDDQADTSVLHPAIHASVFLPQSCPWHDVANHSSPCLQAEMTRSLLPHLHPFFNGGDSQLTTDDVGRWSLDDVAQFVKTIPICGGVEAAEILAARFKDELIDGEALLLVTQNDLIKQMKIKLGPALKIHSSVLYLKHQRCKLTN